MDYVTVRIWPNSRRLLRLIAAQTDEQMVQVLDRLLEDECRKLGLNVAANVAKDTEDKKGKGV